MGSSVPYDRSPTVNQQRAQIHIAALADAKQLRLTAAGALSRDQPDPRNAVALALSRVALGP
jgi:hypothetical protein